MDHDAWGRAARRLEADLSGAPELDRRIHHFYLTVLFFALAERRRWCANAATTSDSPRNRK